MNPERIIILGSGSSLGVPRWHPHMPGGDWGNCDPSDCRNRRTRASIYVDYGGLKLLVDTGPDLLNQVLTQGIGAIDGVLYTHGHSDHTHGIDELRGLFFANHNKSIPVYGSGECLDQLAQRFSYLFQDGVLHHLPALLRPHPIVDTFLIGGHQIQAIPQIHGSGTSLGFRFGNVAYSTDFNDLLPASLDLLKGLDLWILDCLADIPLHASHNTLNAALSWIEQVQPRKAVLTHLDKTLDHKTLQDQLPPHIQVAYDGLIL